MDLDELRSVQSRERQTDSLQQLRESFYRDAGEFIQQLHRERERAAEEADDPWDAPEVNRLSDDIDTAEGTVEAIYERRVGKIVKMASLAAADMPTEDEGLTAEERSLFETLVGAIEENRARVEAVIDGENPAAAAADVETGVETAAGADPATGGADEPAPPADTGASGEAPADHPPDSPTSDPDASGSPGADPSAAGPTRDSAGGDGERGEVPSDPADLGDAPAASGAGGEPTPSPPGDEPAGASGVDAADLMGDGSETADAGDATDDTGPAAPPEESDDGGRDHPPQADGGAGAVDAGGSPESGRETGPAVPAGDGATTESASPSPDEATGGAEDASVDRATVRITSDVGEIFGVDQRAYDLTAEDVVTLPEANAGPLVERDAAERLD
uniref:DNA replication complex subunit Gins51 n=1 Tax=Halosimplex halophilum TaxID=2559572 RepID=UPI00107F9F6F